MPDSHVTVELKARCFAAMTIGGTPIELLVEAIADGKATVAIRAAKKITALRTFQELPGLAQPATPRPPIAGSTDDAARAKRA